MADPDQGYPPAQWPDWPPKPKPPPGPEVPTDEGSTRGYRDTLPDEKLAPIPKAPQKPSPEAVSQAALEPDWFTKFTAGMVSKRDAGVNFLQQVVRGKKKPEDAVSPIEREWLQIAHKYPEDLPTFLGGLVGAVNNPVNWGIMMEVPALLAKEGGEKILEKTLARTSGRLPEAESIGHKMLDDALRAGALSQLSPTENPSFAGRAAQAGQTMAMAAPFGAIWMSPEEISAVIERETNPVKGIEELGGVVQKDVLTPIAERLGRFKRLIPEAHRELTEAFSKEAWKSIARQLRLRIPKQLGEKAEDQMVEQAKRVMEAQGGQIHPSQWIGLQRQVYGPDAFDNDRLPPRELAAKQWAIDAHRRMMQAGQMEKRPADATPGPLRILDWSQDE